MQALVVTDKFSPHAGGTATCWTEWVRCWDSSSVTVVTGGGQAGPIPDFAFRIRRVPFFDIPKLRMPLLWLALFLGTLFEIFRRRPNVLYCGQILETGWIGLFCKRVLGIPYIITLYGEEIPAHASRRWSKAVQNCILSEAAAVTAITQFTVELTRRHTSFRGDIALVYPGVDTSRFQHLPDLPRTDRPTLLTLGRLMKRKGHELVIRSLPQLLGQFPDLVYRIVGIGPEMVRLTALVKELALESQVEFLGKLPDAEVIRHLNQSHLFVHPNRELANGDVEGFGIVFLEASACGLPVIGGNSGGTPEAIAHAQSGFLVDPESAEDFSQCVLRLLREPELWSRMSQFGPGWAAQFTWQRSASVLWALASAL